MLFDTLLDDIVIPRFVRVRDHRVAERIEDVAAAVRQALDSRGAKEALRPGMRVRRRAVHYCLNGLPRRCHR